MTVSSAHYPIRPRGTVPRPRGTEDPVEQASLRSPGPDLHVRLIRRVREVAGRRRPTASTGHWRPNLRRRRQGGAGSPRLLARHDLHFVTQ